MAEQPDRVTDPDRALKWFLSVVAVGVAVNLLSSTIEQERWAWIPPTLFALAVVTVVPRTGLLRREPHAGVRWTGGLAFLSLFAYLGVTIWGTTSSWPLAIVLLSAASLWGTCVLVVWPSLRGEENPTFVAVGASGLLAAIAMLILGTDALSDAHRFTDLMFGAGIAVYGVGLLLFAVTMMRKGLAMAFPATCLFGVGMLSFAVADVLDGRYDSGVALLLLGVSQTLFGVALLRESGTLAVISALIAGLSGLVLGITLIARNGPETGGPTLLIALTGLTLAAALLRRSTLLLGCAALPGAAAMVALGIVALSRGLTLAGVAALLFGTAELVAGAALAAGWPSDTSVPRLGRLKAWLTSR